MGVTSVRLLPEVEDGLEAMSGRLQRSKSWLINQALREYISRESLAEERLDISVHEQPPFRRMGGQHSGTWEATVPGHVRPGFRSM